MSPILDTWIEAYTQVASTNKRAIEKFRLVLAELQAFGIDCVLLKGGDLLTRLYGVWGVRPMLDIDLLVHEKDLGEIDRILCRLGFVQDIDGNPAYRHPDKALALDLVTEIWYTNDIEGIWRRSVKKRVAGFPVRAMGADDLLIFLTAYVVLYRGCFSPAFSKDLALLMDKEYVNWDFIVEQATCWHLRVPLYHGLSYAMGHERISVPVSVMEQLAPVTLKERWLAFVLRRLVTERYISNIGHYLLLITRPRGMKWSWVRQYFFPSEAFLRYRYGQNATAQPWWIRLKRSIHLVWQAQLLFRQVICMLARRT